MKKWKKRLIILGVVLAVVIVAIAFINRRRNSETLSIQTTTLERGTLVDSIYISGSVKSANERKVYSTLSYQVKEILVSEGDRVKAGDTLARLDTQTLELDIEAAELNIKNLEKAIANEKKANQNAVSSAKSSLELSEMDLETAKANLQNAEALGISEAELTSLKNAVKRAEIACENAERALKLAQEKNTDASTANLEIQRITLKKLKNSLENCEIRSPIDGTVTKVNAEPGGSGAGVLFVVEDLDDLIISTNISEYDLGVVRVGMTAEIETDSLGGERISGEVTKVASTGTILPSGVSFEAEVSVRQRDDRIKAGMNTRVYLIAGRKEGVLYVPYEAVVPQDDGTDIVYVSETREDGKPRVRKITVQVGMETDTHLEISSPELSEGMEIVINPDYMYKSPTGMFARAMSD